MLYPLGGKIFSKKPYIFRVPVLYPLRGSFENFGSHSYNPRFRALPLEGEKYLRQRRGF